MTEAALGAAALVLLVGGAWLVAHNRLVQLSQHISESWRDIDVELRRRHDLIPALADVVTAYAAHERSLIDLLTRGRSLVSAEVAAVSERYPQLRASAHFLQLQRQLAETEDRISAARRIHNSNVERYNERVESIPTSLVARVGGFERAAYFEMAAS